MRDLNELFEALGRSEFRSQFRLEGRELDYLREKGRGTVMAHAADFVEKRLAPARPRNDGRQTPKRNHPAFVAQHATATCCRGCLEKWRGIAKGRELTPEEREYVLAVLEEWLTRGAPPPRMRPSLRPHSSRGGAAHKTSVARDKCRSVGSCPAGPGTRRPRR